MAGRYRREDRPVEQPVHISAILDDPRWVAALE
jgi:hypothetical protein